MARLIIYSLILFISLLVAIFSDIQSRAFAIACGFACGFVIPLIDALILNIRFLNIAWYSIRNWNGYIRVSVSYLYRIQVDNEYLLIKGSRFDHFQPVGGVYKSHASFAAKRNDLKILNDDLLTPDDVSGGDLRVRVPGRSLLTFVRWFESGRQREVDCWREFYEELVASDILCKEAFSFIDFDVVERYYHPLRYSDWAKSNELLIADILELLPSPDQLKILRELKSNTDERIHWATEDQVRRRGAVHGAARQQIRIAETAAWTL